MAAARKREPDPPTQLRELSRALDGGALARGYVVRGEERWFRDRGVDLVVKASVARNLEVARHDTKDDRGDFQLSRLLDDLGASPLFAVGRCVVVRNVEPLIKKEEGKHSPFTRAALTFLERDGEGTLVLDANTLRADNVLAKAVAKANGELVTCRKLWDTPPPWRASAAHETELVQWLVGRSRDKQVQLSIDDAVYLAAATGNDLSGLDAELEKLRHADGKSVRELVGWNTCGTPWETAAELLGGNPARALSALEDLFRSGFHKKREGSRELNPAALGAILLGSLRARARETAAAARSLAAGGPACPPGDGVRNERAAQELEARVRTRPPEHWARIYRDVTELDRHTRTGRKVDVNDFARLALRWRQPRTEAGSGRPSR